MIHPHSLQVADIDGDGNLDIFVAEMAKWSEGKKEPDNPKAQAFIFYGDGKGNFRKTVFATGMGFHEAQRGGPQRRRQTRYPEQALQLGCAPRGRVAQPRARAGHPSRRRQPRPEDPVGLRLNDHRDRLTGEAANLPRQVRRLSSLMPAQDLGLSPHSK